VALPHPEEEWRGHLAEGRLMIQRSATTGAYVFYPRVLAPDTGLEDLQWVEAAGEGVIHAMTIVRRKPPEPDYNVVLVDLQEGVRLMSRVVDCPNEALAIGQKVKARIDDLEGQKILVFVPA